MEVLNLNKKPSHTSETKSILIASETLEIIVIEDKKLVNMLFSKTLHSAIDRIRNLKNFPIKFSSFQNKEEFFKHLKNTEFENTRHLVFSELNMEQELNKDELAAVIKQKKLDISIIVMSDESANKTFADKLNKGMSSIKPTKKRSAVRSSEIKEKMVI